MITLYLQVIHEGVLQPIPICIKRNPTQTVMIKNEAEWRNGENLKVKLKIKRR